MSSCGKQRQDGFGRFVLLNRVRNHFMNEDFDNLDLGRSCFCFYSMNQSIYYIDIRAYIVQQFKLLIANHRTIMQEPKIPKIRVLVRKRPLSKKQLMRSETDIIQIEHNQTVIVKQHKLKVDLTPFVEEYRFNFDGAYDEHATNQDIYRTAVRPLVDCAFDGAKVTCFAYGQTGSGKTHTMLGNGSNVRGLYLLASHDIFSMITQHQIEVWVSFYEIYCGKLYDLLNEKNILFARQDAKNNVNIVGLSQNKIFSTENLMQIIEYGMSIRVTSQNGTNSDSSRSHAILQISLKKRNKLHGKISFIDLAGSQRAADHADQLQKQTRIDGAEINKSLLALKECIRALDMGKNHTPFRGSKLTMVLKDSFTGYCRTVMIGNIAPNASSCQNTLNTLKYADRVKQLKKGNRQVFGMQRVQMLERQLMLPRNGRGSKAEEMGHHQIPQNNFMEREEHRQNININLGNNSQKFHPKINKIQAIIQQQNKKNQNQSLSVNQTKPLLSQQRHSPSSSKAYRSNSAVSYPIKALPIQQDQPNQPPLSFLALTQKHDGLVESILQSQQILLKEHEEHINSTIELTKQQMFLRNEADKIGSNIEEYLSGLENVLGRKMEGIMRLVGRVKQIKSYLHESKKIEEMYSKYEKEVYRQQQEESLLDDDQQLFV